MYCNMPGSSAFIISKSLLKFLSIESVMLSNNLILSCHVLLLPSMFPIIRVISNESTPHQVAKVPELQLQHCLSYEYSGLVSFRINWFDLLAVQVTLKNLLQYHNLKAPKHSLVLSLFMVQFSHLYMTTEKNIALTIWTFVSKVIFLLLIRCLGLS